VVLTFPNPNETFSGWAAGNIVIISWYFDILAQGTNCQQNFKARCHHSSALLRWWMKLNADRHPQWQVSARVPEDGWSDDYGERGLWALEFGEPAWCCFGGVYSGDPGSGDQPCSCMGGSPSSYLVFGQALHIRDATGWVP